MKNRACVIVMSAGVSAGAMGQTGESLMGAAGIVRAMSAGEPGMSVILPGGPVVASLTYDGSSSWGFAGQDFESAFDIYDVYVFEDMHLSEDSVLGEFRSAAFGSGNPFATTDVMVEIRSETREVICACDQGDPVLSSIEGAGFFDGTHGVTDFGGQCLEAGTYWIGWQASLDFRSFGQMFFFAQQGAHDVDGGAALADNGWQWDQCAPWGIQCLHTIDGNSGEATGVNFVLFGESGGCAGCDRDPSGCGDWDGDGDSDAADFFGYLDAFGASDRCADLEGDGDWDSDDFFGFLDRFVRPC